jgi:hypothetical protein
MYFGVIEYSSFHFQGVRVQVKFSALERQMKIVFLPLSPYIFPTRSFLEKDQYPNVY